MNGTFFKLFRDVPGEGRDRAARLTGAPGVPAELGPSLLPLEDFPAPAARVRGAVEPPLDAPDGTAYT